MLPDRVRLDDAPTLQRQVRQLQRRQRRLPADHRLAAAGRAGARRRRAGAGADRGTAGRHPAGAAQLVDPVPRGRVGDRGALARARAGQAARSHRTADPPVRAGRGLPAAAGRRAARHGRRLPGGARLGRPGVRPGHRRWSSPGRCCSPSWSPWRAGSSRPRCRRGRCSGGRCPSCCAGCRRGARARAAGLVDGVVVVLAIAGVVQLVSDRGGRPSPVALLGPGMVAVAGGLLAARILVRVARRRTTVSMERGRAAGVVGWAGVARRPGTARIASVLAVATCLLLVGVQAWTVAERNRAERSGAETGAEVVLQVRAPSSQALLDAVRAADPSGGYAMAAVQVSSDNQATQLLAVDAQPRRPGARVGRPRRRPVAPVSETLHPPLADAVAAAAGPARGDGRPAGGADPVAAAPHRPARRGRPLGAGRPRRAAARPAHVRRSAAAPGAPQRSCRLAALAVDHPGTDIDSATATCCSSPSALAPAGGGCAEPLVDGRSGSPGAWRPGAPTVGGPEVAAAPRRRRCGSSCAHPAGRSPRSCTATRPSRCRRSSGAARPARRAERGRRAASARPPAWPAQPLRYLATARSRYVPRLGDGRRPGRPRAGAAAVRRRRPSATARSGCRATTRAPSGRCGPGWRRPTSRRSAARPAAQLANACTPATAPCWRCGCCSSAAPPRWSSPSARCSSRRTSAAGSAPTRSRRCAWSACVVAPCARCCCARTSARSLVALACGAVAALVATWVVLPALPQFDDPSDVRRGALRARRRLGLGGRRRSRPASRRGRPRGRRPAAAQRSPRPPAGRSPMIRARDPGLCARPGAHLPAGGQRRRRAVRRRPRRRRRRGGRPARPVRARASRRCSTCSPGCCGRAPAG